MNLDDLQRELQAEGWVLFRIWYDPTEPRPWNIGAHTKGSRKFSQGWGKTLAEAVSAMRANAERAYSPPKKVVMSTDDLMKALNL